MATQTRFLQSRINKLPLPEHGRTYYRDPETPGLQLCVWASGLKVYEYCRWVKGAKRTLKCGRVVHGEAVRIKLGNHPEISVAQARNLAELHSGKRANGTNPADAMRAMRKEPTFGELWKHYLEAHAKGKKRSWEEDVRQYDTYLSPWANTGLAGISQSDVRWIHSQVGAGEHPRQLAAVKDKKRKAGSSHYAANRLLALISTIFGHADGLGFHGPNPVKGVERFKERSRDRFMQTMEVRRFLDALEEADELWRDFFKVALLTGARRSNVQAMKWDDLELDRGLWRISEDEAKGGEPIIVVLVPAVVEILRRRLIETGGGVYVFASRESRSGHISEPKSAWKKILAAANLDGLRMHDLRRTLGSWQALAGVSLAIIGRSLGHKSLQATQVYARLNVDPIRESVTAATAAMLGAGSVAGDKGE